jgi:tetratricopeptide (TPR) repeat protein
MIVLYRVFLSSLSLIVTIALWFNSPVWAACNENTSAIFNSGLDRVRQQNYQQALVDFTQVINRQDNLNLVGAAYSNRCLINLQLQNYFAAEADCMAAIEHNSDNIEAYLNLGLAYYRREEYQGAIAQYQQVIQRDRYDYRAYYNRGLAHFAFSDYQQAIADYNLALMSPRLVNAQQKTLIYNDRGLTYMMLADYERAIADFEQAIASQHHNYTAYFNRGCAHHRQGNHLAALEDFTQVVQLKPDFTQAYVNRGVLHHQIGRDRAAFADLDIALQQYQKQGDRLAYDLVFNLKQKLFHSQPSQLA